MERPSLTERFLYRTLPAGIWTLPDGGEILFSAGRVPIWKRARRGRPRLVLPYVNFEIVSEDLVNEDGRHGIPLQQLQAPSHAVERLRWHGDELLKAWGLPIARVPPRPRKIAATSMVSVFDVVASDDDKPWLYLATMAGKRIGWGWLPPGLRKPVSPEPRFFRSRSDKPDILKQVAPSPARAMVFNRHL